MVYPLRTGERASETLEDFTVSREDPVIDTAPEHILAVTPYRRDSRKGEHESGDRLRGEQSVLDRDFVLYYGVSKKDFGLNLLTHAEQGRGRFLHDDAVPSVIRPTTRWFAAGRALRLRHFRQHVRREDRAGPRGAQVLRQEARTPETASTSSASAPTLSRSGETLLAVNEENRAKAARLLRTAGCARRHRHRRRADPRKR